MHKIWILSPLEQLFHFTNLLLFFSFLITTITGAQLRALPRCPKNTLQQGTHLCQTTFLVKAKDQTISSLMLKSEIVNYLGVEALLNTQCNSYSLNVIDKQYLGNRKVLCYCSE